MGEADEHLQTHWLNRQAILKTKHLGRENA